MKPKLLPLLERCISDGVERGWNRAHKHHDEPDERHILNEIEQCVVHEIFEWFDFEELKDA